MAKFWILFLTLTQKKGCPKTTLDKGLVDLAVYGLENSCDNRIIMAEFLPEDIDQQEVLMDSILLEKWQEHCQDFDVSQSHADVESQADFINMSEHKQHLLSAEDVGGIPNEYLLCDLTMINNENENED